MNKKVYYSLMATFVCVFVVGMMLLTNQSEDYNLEMWSYYSGGQNKAIDDFNRNSDYKIKFTGIAADNYTTKLDAAISNNQLPDILMIDSNDLGRYINTDYFIDYNQIFTRDKQYDQYKESASKYGLNLGQNQQGEQTAIKFENSSSIFVYRSDLASICLGINSPEEMEEQTNSYRDYTRLYGLLQASNNPNCKNLSMFATSEYTNYLLNPSNIIENHEVNPSVIEWLDWVKENIDTSMVYSRYGKYHELIDDSGETSFFGDVTTVNQLRSIYDFNQPGKWAIAQTSINYQGNTSYFLISKDANIEAVKEFFDMTYFNQSWLTRNINDIGILENQNINSIDLMTSLDLNKYFTNKNLGVTLSKVGMKSINDNQDKTSNYDYGIRNTITGVINDYVDGKLAKDEVINKINSDLEIFYNG